MANSGKPSRQEKTTPNIVFILCDNVGWGDFSCYGGSKCIYPDTAPWAMPL